MFAGARFRRAAAGRIEVFFMRGFSAPPARESKKKKLRRRAPVLSSFLYTRARVRVKKNRRRLSAATRTRAYSFSAAGGVLRSRRPPCFTAEYVRPASARRKSPRISRASALVDNPRARALARKSSAMVLSTTKMTRSFFCMAHIMRAPRAKKRKKNRKTVLTRYDFWLLLTP